jgi:hypothetical protein
MICSAHGVTWLGFPRPLLPPAHPSFSSPCTFPLALPMLLSPFPEQLSMCKSMVTRIETKLGLPWPSTPPPAPPYFSSSCSLLKIPSSIPKQTCLPTPATRSAPPSVGINLRGDSKVVGVDAPGASKVIVLIAGHGARVLSSLLALMLVMWPRENHNNSD